MVVRRKITAPEFMFNTHIKLNDSKNFPNLNLLFSVFVKEILICYYHPHILELCHVPYIHTVSALLYVRVRYQIVACKEMS
jgi:hypothetical protein